MESDLFNQDVLDSVNQDEEAYRTALAIYILEEQFDDRFDEWELIAEKGEEYLDDKNFNYRTISRLFPSGFLA